MLTVAGGGPGVFSWVVPGPPAAAAAAASLSRARARACSARPRRTPFSPTELSTFSESPWASWLDRLAREQPSHPLAAAADPPDAFLQMLGRKGEVSEASVLHALATGGGSSEVRGVDLSGVRGTHAERVAATRAAIAEAPDVIYQAPLMGGGFFGVADFLVRADAPCGGEAAAEAEAGSGTDDAVSARYAVWDAKLARQPRPSQVLQLCCYAEMLAPLQGGAVAPHVGLVLGATPLRLPTAAYLAVYRRTRDRFLAAQAGFDPAAMPEPPAPRAPTGRWSGLAAAQLEERDDLRLVARLSRKQAAGLQAAGVRTVEQLAARVDSPPEVGGVPPAVVRRLCRQAALQLTGRRAAEGTPPPYELLGGACARAVGLGALPEPHAADAFFDLEGFPFAALPSDGMTLGLDKLLGLASAEGGAGGDGGAAEGGAAALGRAGGREYLWGISTRPNPGRGGEESYLAWWAHSEQEEREALISCVDWITARRRAHPDMHVYHYGMYEVSVLRRLAGRYGVREAEVDEILRSGTLVDLYEVVRHSLLLGEPRYDEIRGWQSSSLPRG